MEHDYALPSPDINAAKKKTQSLGRQCVAFGCNNYQYKLVNNERVSTGNRFFCFPEDEASKKEWCRLIKRTDGIDNFNVKKSTRVCGIHFRPCDFLPNGSKLDRATAKPLLHAWNNFTAKQPRRQLIRVCHDVEEATTQPVVEYQHDEEEIVPIPDLDLCLNDDLVQLDDPVDLMDLTTDAPETVAHLTGRIQELEKENITLRKENAALKSALDSSLRDQFTKHVLSDDDACAHATGFHSVQRLKEFFDFVNPGKQGNDMLMARSQVKVGSRRPRVLTPLEGFLLLLCRLKSNFTIWHLSFLFGIATGTVEAHFTMWLSFVYFKVASISWWPSKETVMSTMPQSMKNKFPSTRVIIDCSEFPAQNPSSLSMQKLMYSQYKGRVTVKVLLGIMPGGGFTFVSSAFPGSASDREIVMKSGILNPALYENGDSIMADRGFTIKDLLEPMGVNLIIPAFLNRREQLTEEEIILTQQIAAERIHVERAIQRLKIYSILDCVPVTAFDSINQIITVCAMLSNLQNPIISA